MLNFMGVLNATSAAAAAAAHANVSCFCNCKRAASYSSTEITQLEFVQILVIVMVMMVMVVVITCLLNHYRLSARSLLSRHGHNQRRHLSLANETGLCSSEAPGGASGLNEQQVYVPRPPSRGLSASYLHRDLQSPQSQSSQRFQYSSNRFQPTYPYLPQSLIDLPPTISLSDGEEPPPYQGLCTLQLRNPEQQMELNRESVRAPPNRTVYDSHLLDPSPSCLQARLQAAPPNGHAGLSTLEAQEVLAPQQKHRPQLEGAPPAYSEVIGHYYHPTSLELHHHQHHETAPTSLNPPSSLEHGLIRHTSQQQAPPTPGIVDNRNVRNQKEKSHNPQQV